MAITYDDLLDRDGIVRKVTTRRCQGLRLCFVARVGVATNLPQIMRADVGPGDEEDDLAVYGL